MDLLSIKRQVENGSIRTTSEFQRDMMLMFTNAIMYNSSNQDVYKMALKMYDDVMDNIEVSVVTSYEIICMSLCAINCFADGCRRIVAEMNDL